MKKVFVLFLMSYISLSKFYAVGQTDDPVKCNETLFEVLLGAENAIDDFLLFTKSGLSYEQGKEFFAKLKEDEVADAFKLCGLLQAEMESRYITAHNALAKCLDAMRTEFGQDATLSESGKSELFSAKLDCYVRNTVLNAEKLAPPEIGDLPDPEDCRDELKRCKRTARRNRIAGWWACAMGGLGIATVTGGLGAGVGVSCIVTNVMIYNEAIDDCYDSFNNCMKN